MKNFISIILIFFLSACSGGFLSSSGPGRSDIETASKKLRSSIHLRKVDSKLTQELIQNEQLQTFSNVFTNIKQYQYIIRSGDILEVNIWEADPPILFSGSQGLAISGGNKQTLPEQMVNDQGEISVPFAGKIKANGKTISQIETAILQNLQARANQPQVMVRLAKNLTSNITVVGEVNQSGIIPVTPRKEKVLDIIAAAGGVKQSVNKTTIQITRDNKTTSMALNQIIQDSKQNINLQPGDVVTAYYQPLSFTVLGATVKNEEINFEGQGINLSQALGRMGGINDLKSDPKGVFIFRFEERQNLNPSFEPKVVTKDNKIPMIYQVNMDDPETFFVIQNFKIKNKDLIYVSNSPSAELQKFLNVVISIVYPIVNIDRFLGN